jgi:hypothetical protein
MNGEMLTCMVAGSFAVVYARPWRLFWSRRHCPQCEALLPRWDVWGWKEHWDCEHCGCVIER